MRTIAIPTRGILLLVVGLLFFTGCRQNSFQPTLLELNQNWKFRDIKTNQWYTATVPGTVHLDLLTAGLIKHPYHRYNEDSIKWIENRDWEYACSFAVNSRMLKKKRIELVFEGLDTYAEVYLNDSLLVRTDNMFIQYACDIKKYLQRDTNRLRIIFRSPVRMGMQKLVSLPYQLKAINEQQPENKRTNVFTRKAPFHYGWDWGPRLVTSGIWKKVYIRGWDKALLEDVYLKPTHISTARATYTAEMTVYSGITDNIECQLSVNGRTVIECPVKNLREGSNYILFDFDIPQPRLWWTHNLGEPYLYTVEIAVLRRNRKLDTRTIMLGVRTLEVVQEPDSAGRSFFVRLNGVPVFMKGANYIPPDILTPVASTAAYNRVISDAVNANMNMLRVWGGAVYESDQFYDLCDRKGILVWQDFMFACALMPPFRQHLLNIRQEAVFTVKRLRNHACLALWCGNNENLIAWHQWGWKNQYPPEVADRLWRVYKNIFYTILPDAVNTYDGQRLYWSSSPSSFDNQLPDRQSGDEHDWTVWFGQKPFTSYSQNMPRFVSEYGLQSFPDTATLLAFSDSTDWYYRSAMYEHRQRCRMPWISTDMNGNEMIKKYSEQYFRKAKDFPSFVYVSQLMQAEGLKAAIESHRKAMPHCMGSLYWQIDDCWPAISWATVDYYGRWKAAHYMVKKAFADISVIPAVEQDEVKVYIVSDKLKSEKALLKIRSMSFTGKRLFTDSISINIQPNQSAVYYCDSRSNLIKRHDPGSAFIYFELIPTGSPVATNILFFKKNRELSFPVVSVKAVVTGEADQYTVKLSSDTLARYLYLSADVEGFFSDNYFDLLPDIPVTVTFKPAQPLRNKKYPVVFASSLVDSYK